jgi:acyl carrier protein
MPRRFQAMSEIGDKVRAIICDQLMVDPDEVTDESSFVEDLGADSLDTVELIMEFEDEFGVEIPDEEAEKISSVGEAVAFLEKLRANKTA